MKNYRNLITFSQVHRDVPTEIDNLGSTTPSSQTENGERK